MMNRRMFLMAGAAWRVSAQSQEKLLMVHADDSGMCHSANVATIEALKHGMVVSTSIMMPCAWVPEMAEYARANTQADLGLHLTLTSEWKRYRWRPVAPAASVPGLLDADGYLHRDVRAVAAKASAKEVETEVRAQIALARQYGIAFTHLDSHMGTLFARPDYFEVYTRVARETGVPCMLPKPTPELAREMANYPVTPAMIEAAHKTGLPYLDRLVTGVPGRTVAERAESYRKFLQELRPGTTKLIVHLAMNDDEIKAITGNWEQRYADFKFFTDPATRALMEQLGIRTITYRELVQRAK
jgi:predicted glycoside hydrolase/deacetylase ChbG (UPF0249 family)